MIPERRNGVRPLLTFALLSLTIPSPIAAQESPFGEDFAREVGHYLSHWGAPGVVISVVKDGRVLLADGFGTRRIGESGSPTGQTLTPVQSVTKPITSLAVAMLVDDGTVAWDEPIRTYIPEFETADPQITMNATLRDLLTHRSGLPNALSGGLYSEGFTGAELIRDLPEAETSRAFRDYIHYSQIGLAVVGEVIRRQTGMPWPDFIEERVFRPLEMMASFPNTPKMIEALGDPEGIGNLHWPAVREDGQIVNGPWRVISPAYCPAGCIVTTAEDMTSFMFLVLNKGMHEGVEVVSAGSLAETMAPHTVRLSGFATDYAELMNPLSPLMTWGMGWGIYQAFGRMIIEHPGSGQGSSVVAVVPSEDLGVFVSTNGTFSTDSDRLASALKFLAIETALGLERTNWISVLGVGGG